VAIYDGTVKLAGGSAWGVLIYDGTLEVAGGSTVGAGGAVFLNSGTTSIDTLVLDASTSFHGTVGGFGTRDQIDLEDIAFGTTKKSQVSYTNSGLSGTLNVTDGVHTASIQLLGSYMASEFVAASDGHGGTLITFTSATATNGGHGHGAAVASPVTS